MELLSWYRPGQIVVCVDDTFPATPRHPPLRKGDIYDITDIAPSPRRPDVICFALLQHGRFLYPAFLFKPAKQTSIDCFRQLEREDA